MKQQKVELGTAAKDASILDPIIEQTPAPRSVPGFHRWRPPEGPARVAVQEARAYTTYSYRLS